MHLNITFRTQDIFYYPIDIRMRSILLLFIDNIVLTPGNEFMSASYLPSILVPLVGLVFPAITMVSLFLYIEQDEIV